MHSIGQTINAYHLDWCHLSKTTPLTHKTHVLRNLDELKTD